MSDPCPICDNDPCTCEQDYICHKPTTADMGDEEE